MREWVMRHGAHPDMLEFPVLRAMYNMVFGYEKGHLERPKVAAGIGMLLFGMLLFTYKGAIFWKMTAGMGDIVIAPIYEVLRRRGVKFEFFHRVDALHLDARRHNIDAITMGRQLWLADNVDHYEPLTRVHGLPVFPNSATGATDPGQGGSRGARVALRRPRRRRAAGASPRCRLRSRRTRRVAWHGAGGGPGAD